MADAVSSQTVFNGTRKLIVKLTNVSDGTGESAVKKVDASDFSASEFRIEKVHYATSGMGARLLWDADTDVDAVLIPADGYGCLDFSEFGGIPNNAGAGKTGDINLTTVGHTANDMYTITLELLKA
jgi:hypothetical protein